MLYYSTYHYEDCIVIFLKHSIVLWVLKLNLKCTGTACAQIHSFWPVFIITTLYNVGWYHVYSSDRRCL
jgi:hypothetical protein